MKLTCVDRCTDRFFLMGTSRQPCLFVVSLVFFPLTVEGRSVYVVAKKDHTDTPSRFGARYLRACFTGHFASALFWCALLNGTCVDRCTDRFFLMGTSRQPCLFVVSLGFFPLTVEGRSVYVVAKKDHTDTPSRFGARYLRACFTGHFASALFWCALLNGTCVDRGTDRFLAGHFAPFFSVLRFAGTNPFP